MILGKRFFQRSTPEVAKDLLGKYLVRRFNDGRVLAEMITEVEIYDGPKDKASHASKGKTLRTAPMFEAGGIFYVYLCYGMYQMLNIVTGDRDYPAAILIRATRETRGPGRLTGKFAIDKKFNNQPATRETGLWFEDRKRESPPQKIVRTPRTGVDYAGEIWKNKRYKFSLKNEII
ncbi:MAG: DNA-3-methyladenine glycosylase [Candidatus Paceibacterota bacterium]|jgi:DNA-3-methyladenine glycosylase